MVEKREGHLEPLNLDKIHKVLNWAAENLVGVSVSEVELKSQLQFFDNIKTEDIHETLIKTAADLISERTTDYQYMAARLAIFHLRKKAYKGFTPPHIYEHVVKMVDKGLYDKELLEKYSEEEFNQMNNFIDHMRDLNFSYAAVKQLEGKYLVQDRVKKRVYESPQFAYVLIGAVLFGNYPKSTRMTYVKRFYEAVSTFKISLPTPIMAGVRTPTRQFSSCVLIESGDTLDSINASSAAIVNYVSKRAGIGINAGGIRAIKSKIRGGEAEHTGLLPFYKLFQAAVKSCSQGGIRGGAATLFYPMWHLEIESLLVLKNNKGTEENRIRHLDYSVQLNKTMYQRFLQGKDITLFSPNEVPGLYEAFFADQDKFEELYTKYENDPSIRKKSISAKELFSLLILERSNTGRIYIQNVDHCNTHSAFNPELAPIRQSNLCMEITLPTKPVSLIDREAGEVALCTLSAFNLGAIDNLDEFEELSDLTVRALDSLLTYQDYFLDEAKKASLLRRTLGVGVTNLAYYLAKNHVKYSDGSANGLVHRTFEAMQYYLLKASNKLAKEQGACELFNQTTYAKGILPIDSYKKDVDAYCQEPLRYDWEQLRKDILAYGLRNSTLSALMPCETSSQISNSTNGIEPARAFITVKGSKTGGIMKQVVPEYEQLKDYYELAWQMKGNAGYIQLIGIMQKFVDQSISANTYYDPSDYPDNKVPMNVMLKDLLTAYKFGVKTLYYHNTRTNDGENFDDDCVSCKV
jgi:ribonucleoside-diphosphate reductase alpha chain